jgi:hypothetical protein
MNFLRLVNAISFVATVAVTLVMFDGCARPSTPEQQVRALIDAAEHAAQARDVSALLGLVSEQYADQRGDDKAALRNLVRGYFLVNQSIHLLMRVEDVRFPADGLAQARVTVGMLGTRASNDWSLAVDVYEFDLELRREAASWRLTRAAWHSLQHDS